MAKDYKIKDFLKRIKNTILIKDGVSYKRVTVSGNHKGVSLRDEVDGFKIGTKKQFTIKGGDFILSKIDARNGAFGIIPESLDSAIITGNFWTYKVDTQLVDIEWFFYFTHSFNFIQICIESSTGSTHRKYLDEKVFLNHDIVLPTKSEQIEMVRRYKEQTLISNNLFKEISVQKSTISKLKQAILQEAIQGKLSREWREQNPSTKPASELLERIKAEKEQLIKDKKIRKEKPLSPIKEEEIPFELPANWVWCRLGEIAVIKSGKRIHKADYRDSGVPFLRSGEIGSLGRGENIKRPLFISKEKYSQIKSKFGVPKSGDILIACIGGSIGNTWIVDDREFYFKDGNLVLIESTRFFETNYLLSYLKSRYFWNNTILNATDSSYNALTIIKLNQAIFPLPPLEEQKAIIEKVKTLMQKCNALEQEITQSEQYANMLMQAVLKEAFEDEKSVGSV